MASHPHITFSLAVAAFESQMHETCTHTKPAHLLAYGHANSTSTSGADANVEMTYQFVEFAKSIKIKTAGYESGCVSLQFVWWLVRLAFLIQRSQFFSGFGDVMLNSAIGGVDSGTADHSENACVNQRLLVITKTQFIWISECAVRACQFDKCR
jgi:hypothetical protein